MNEKAKLLVEIYETVIGKNEEFRINTLADFDESLLRVKIFNELYAKFGDGVEE
jgi:hypothetical protein